MENDALRRKLRLTSQSCGPARSDSLGKTSSTSRESTEGQMMKKVGIRLLSRLKMKCICCNQSSCTGSCVANGLKGVTCYHCLGSHYAKRCTKDYRKILAGKACYSCWLYNYSDDVRHDHTVCSGEGGIKERLRALIQYNYVEKTKKVGNSTSFKTHLAGIFAGEEAFFRFLYKYRDSK